MSLKVWLPLDGNLHNQGTSNYIISVFRGTETYDNNGKIGKCFYAHGTNTLKILNILPDIYNYSAYSLCAWCYIEAQNTSHSGSGIISGGNWNNQLLNLAISDWSSDHYTKLRISGSNWSRTYNYNFYKNTWYHIVVCDDGTHTYGYVNGALIGDTATSFLPTSIEGTDICIGGATYYPGMQFFGKINDVRIYDHCLSAAEVREIAQGLILHYKLDDGVTIAKNLIKNGYGELGTTNWNSSTSFSSEVPPNHPEIKKSIYNNNITTEYIPIESAHSYKLEVYLKNSATSGYTYPSLYPYDIDKNFISYYQCPVGFNLTTMTTLKQELKSGDTKIYVNDLSKWNENSGTYYNHAAIFSYSDSTGYIYPDGTYTRDTPTFGSGTTAKTNLDKTNNIITLNSAYSGPTKPVGTAICAATEGATYYYPFGGLIKSSLNDWTYKSVIMTPDNITRLKYAKYIRYSTYDGTLHAGIKLIDLADDIDSTTISDSSGYGHNGKIINTLNIFSNTPKYEASTYFSNSAHIKTLNFNFPSNIWTVSCWYYRDTNPSTYEAIFCLSKGNGADANKKIAAIPNSGRIWFKGESGSLSISKLNISIWTMLTMTCDGTTVKIYENNFLIGSFSAGSQMTECTDLIIGARANSANATSIAVPYTGSISDFRIYCTSLLDTDIKSLYNISMKVDKQQNIHTFDIEEKLQNIMYKSNFAIGAQLWQDGLNRYTQTNCQVNLTNNGVYIYRPANLNQTDNGNTMYGGLKIVNSTVDNIHVYDSNIDNIFNLQKGHTYIWIFHIKGNTTNAPSFQINNNMGWGGGGLIPTPSNVTIKNISSNFNGETEVWYKFTINDDIIKTCTSAYSSFVANNQYLSYKHFGWNWGYATTGNGTNIYITNIRLYDITNIPTGKLTKSGIIKFSSIFEVNNTIHLTKNEDLILNQFIER